MITHRKTCRDCGSPLDTVLNLGDLAISTFPEPGDTDPVSRAPLHLVQCQRPTCGLVQLADTVDPALLFQQQYWYQSGINETMVEELRSVVQLAQTYTLTKRGSLVLDIGANDGTLLQQYSEHLHRIAVEPSPTFTDALSGIASDTHVNFFPNDEIVAEYRGKVRIITSIACVYDLDDPHAFVEGIRQLLAPDGVWVLQFQDLAQMLAATAFDNLCHEHLTYLSLQAVEHLLQPHGLRVIHAERRAINGGSLRLVVGHTSSIFYPSTTVQDLRIAEAGCHHWETLSRFSWRVDQAKRQIQGCVQAAIDAGATIDLLGASTKGNTLLQVCGLGPQHLRQAWERSQAKWGRETVTGIPIVSEEDGRADPPDGFLCGIWQFAESVMRREVESLRGKWIIVPLPEVTVRHVLDKTLDEMREL